VAGLALVVCCLWSADLMAAPGSYLNRAYGSSASPRTSYHSYPVSYPAERNRWSGQSTVSHESSAPEGIRYVYVKMTPAKEARLEEIKRDSRNLPMPKFEKVIDGKHPAVVRIRVEGEAGVLYHGSGTLVGISANEGIIVTNWHVIRDRVGAVSAEFPDGFVATARILKVDKTWDLAALAVDRPRATPVKLADRIPRIGDVLTIAGYARGSYRQSSGRMLQFCSPGATEPAEMIEVTTAARNGDSGGPIFSQDGALAGVLFGSISGTTNGSHVGRVRQFLRPLLAESAPAQGEQARSLPASYSQPNTSGQ
jgi:S1-C subfamily serine protease